ncbi:MAG: hypothetical protein AABW89_05465 [Nanoarchaeota archaeon]
MNKRGQVFLMAALIIVGILISLSRISNESTSGKKPEAFFDLADEIDFETKRVLDYGVINSQTNISDLASQLLTKYGETIGNHDVAFVYGDYNNVYAYYYENVNVVAVSILSNNFVTLRIANGREIDVRRSQVDNTATVRIGDVDYLFDLKPGQNFYFILAKEENGEKFVTVE